MIAPTRTFDPYWAVGRVLTFGLVGAIYNQVGGKGHLVPDKTEPRPTNDAPTYREVKDVT